LTDGDLVSAHSLKIIAKNDLADGEIGHIVWGQCAAIESLSANAIKFSSTLRIDNSGARCQVSPTHR
jgi:hypothetical protein